MFTPTRLIRPKYLGEQYNEILAPDPSEENPIFISMSDEMWTVSFQRKMDQPMLIAYYCEKVVDIVFNYLLTEEQRMELSAHFKVVAINLFRALTSVYQQACYADQLPMGKVYIDWFKVAAPYYREKNDLNLYLSGMMVCQISIKPVDDRKEAANDA